MSHEDSPHQDSVQVPLEALPANWGALVELPERFIVPDLVAKLTRKTRWPTAYKWIAQWIDRGWVEVDVEETNRQSYNWDTVGRPPKVYHKTKACPRK